MQYKELKAALKELGCWKEFKTNLKMGSKEHRKALKSRSHPLYILLKGAFQWHKTPEGSKFWLEVHDKLIKYKPKDN